MQATIIATTSAIILLLSYAWAYYHYYRVSKSRSHNVLYSLTGGKWPPKYLKPRSEITAALYKTAIIMLIDILRSSGNSKSLKPQVMLTLLLISAQLIELCCNRLLKRIALIYCTCISSILILATVFATTGLIVSLFQIGLNSESMQSEYVNKLHRWYWKGLATIWVIAYALTPE